MDTIAAIATPIGSAGIGIIRISGPEAPAIARRLFQKRPAAEQSGFRPGQDYQLVSHCLSHGFICDPLSRQVIDEVLMVWMAAPHSFTREDVVEIQSHSGPLLLQKLLALVFDAGARPAEPGEFTRRAFLNGRIDLSQAEAIIDLINAQSEGGLVLAANHLAGGMKDEISRLIQDLTQASIELQARVDFPEDVPMRENDRSLKNSLTRHILPAIERLQKAFQATDVYRHGLHLSIVGRPNVGKSSLLNQLSNSDKAIVTPYPGTTRDPVELTMQLNGIPFRFTDTAGLHASNDPIEQIGMQKTRESIDCSDAVILVVEADRPMTAADIDLCKTLAPKKLFVVINKIDLAIPSPNHIPAAVDHFACIALSALSGEGLEDFKQALMGLCGNPAYPASSLNVVPTVRHKRALDTAYRHLEQAKLALEKGIPTDMVFFDLDLANSALKTIVGQAHSMDLLDDIFSQFCIGK